MQSIFMKKGERTATPASFFTCFYTADMIFQPNFDTQNEHNYAVLSYGA